MFDKAIQIRVSKCNAWFLNEIFDIRQTKEHGDGEIRRRVHILRLKKDENYGIIRYRKSGGNYAYLHIHIKRKIRLN